MEFSLRHATIEIRLNDIDMTLGRASQSTRIDGGHFLTFQEGNGCLV
jgi:hypothetical protein